MEPTEEPSSKEGSFPPTRWTYIKRVKEGKEREHDDAVAVLCEAYWRPVYFFVRRYGKSPQDAEDITQGFFEQFLRRDDFAKADRNTGKLRTFILAALSNFMTNLHVREQRLKRGGGKTIISLDEDPEEGSASFEPSENLTPDRQFERSWAETLLRRALNSVGETYGTKGKGDLFEVLSDYLKPWKKTRPRSEAAAELGMNESAFKVALHRLRKQYGEELAREIAETLEPGGDVQDELRYLYSIWNEGDS
ncbi:MAG: sigma-70 family RNA polymerase sigma factor [Verrucomicrobiota bacterium]